MGEENSSAVDRVEEKGTSDPMAIGHQLHLAQYRDMLDAILENREPLVNGTISRKSLELIRGIYASSNLGRLVDFND